LEATAVAFFMRFYTTFLNAFLGQVDVSLQLCFLGQQLCSSSESRGTRCNI